MKAPSAALECRFCGAALRHTFADLGSSPLANSYLEPEALLRVEPFYPLHVFACDSCLLVQLPEFESPERLFSDYAYFSSFADSWLEHSRRYVEAMIDRFHLGSESQVIEVASNDGYLLQYFRRRGVPVLGIEPARNVAAEAIRKGIPTRVEFFGAGSARKLAGERIRGDLLLGNNVLAHVPDLNDFVEGIRIALAPEGVVTMEFPHLLRLVGERQFDTIYHEHFSYFSFLVVREVFAAHALNLFDVEELPTHGGSLRIYGRHENDESKHESDRVEALLERERRAGLHELATYLSFQEKIHETKRALLRFLTSVKGEGGAVAAYGAAAKGNTLLNYCGIGREFIDYVVDRSPHKQGRYLPGSRIPIHAPERIFETRPDFLLVLPWNLLSEIREQMGAIREWGGRFVVAIPTTRVLD